jgi:hypothetical protein
MFDGDSNVNDESEVHDMKEHASSALSDAGRQIDRNF